MRVVTDLETGVIDMIFAVGMGTPQVAAKAIKDAQEGLK